MVYKTNRSKKQEKLFDIVPQLHAESVGASRVMFGAAAEYIACKTLGLDSIKIDGTFDVNFDAECCGTFYEIKSVRRSGGKIVCYDWRINKEREFPTLMYCIVAHNIAGCSSGIIERMAGNCEILLCPAHIIHDLAKELPLRVHSDSPNATSRFGYTRKGYKDGYRNLSVASLVKLVRFRVAVTAEIDGVIYKIPVSII